MQPVEVQFLALVIKWPAGTVPHALAHIVVEDWVYIRSQGKDPNSTQNMASTEGMLLSHHHKARKTESQTTINQGLACGMAAW